MSNSLHSLMLGRLLPIAMAAVISGGMVSSCKRDLPDPFVPEDPDPGSISIPDETLRTWLLWNYDSDKDGSLSAEEADEVTVIELSSETLSSLEGIRQFKNLSHLSTGGHLVDGKNTGKLTEVDLSGNPALKHIHLIHNNIKTLKMGEHPDLSYLDLDYNHITAIEVRKYKHLNLLQVSFNDLKQIDVSGLDELEEFDCDDNPVETITLSNAILKSFRCKGTSITELDLSKCPKINNVDCSSCPNLTRIILARGQMLGSLTKDDNVKIEYHE